MKSDIHKARMNGSSAGRRQYIPDGEKPVSVEEVIEWLVSASQSSSTHIGVRQAANHLLEQMADGDWRVTAARHEGGFGGNGRGADQNTHVTLSVGGRGYHLQLTVDGHLRRITGDQVTEKIGPWLAPGSVVRRL
jgi:hypothetical protein